MCTKLKILDDIFPHRDILEISGLTNSIEEETLLKY